MEVGGRGGGDGVMIQTKLKLMRASPCKTELLVTMRGLLFCTLLCDQALHCGH